MTVHCPDFETATDRAFRYRNAAAKSPLTRKIVAAERAMVTEFGPSSRWTDTERELFRSLIEEILTDAE